MARYVDRLRVNVPVHTHDEGYKQKSKDQPQELDGALHVNFIHEEGGVVYVHAVNK